MLELSPRSLVVFVSGLLPVRFTATLAHLQYVVVRSEVFDAIWVVE
jgi:hypothetical protein